MLNNISDNFYFTVRKIYQDFFKENPQKQKVIFGNPDNDAYRADFYIFIKSEEINFLNPIGSPLPIINSYEAVLSLLKRYPKNYYLNKQGSISLNNEIYTFIDILFPKIKELIPKIKIHKIHTSFKDKSDFYSAEIKTIINL